MWEEGHSLCTVVPGASFLIYALLQCPVYQCRATLWVYKCTDEKVAESWMICQVSEPGYPRGSKKTESDDLKLKSVINYYLIKYYSICILSPSFRLLYVILPTFLKIISILVPRKQSLRKVM